MNKAVGKAGIALLVLLAVHLAIGIGRIPNRVIGRRVDDIQNYRVKGAARFLLEDAKLEGASQLDWVLANTDEFSVILWRWPCVGALEFAASLLTPRLIVDERDVPVGATTFAGRDIAIGTTPSGEHGLITLLGTDTAGLRLTTRPN